MFEHGAGEKRKRQYDDADGDAEPEQIEALLALEHVAEKMDAEHDDYDADQALF